MFGKKKDMKKSKTVETGVDSSNCSGCSSKACSSKNCSNSKCCK